jgi:hypothetical protein
MKLLPDFATPDSKKKKISLPDWYILKPKIPILGKFWKVLQWKTLIFFMANVYTYYMANWFFYGQLVRFVVIWYYFSRFGMFY